MKKHATILFITPLQFLLFTLILSAVFSFSACKSNKKAQEKEKIEAENQNRNTPPPSWVNSRPISSSYYIGIGIANKRIHSTDFADIAKRNALNDLASEITVNISANSLLYSIEKDNKFQQDFLSSTRLSTQKELSDYEVFDSYENADSYYIYYRLSKAKYQEEKQRKINMAVDNAMNYYTRGRELEKSNQAASALYQYIKSLEAIKMYLGEPLEAFMEDNKVFFGNRIVNDIENILSDLQIVPTRELIELRFAAKDGNTGATYRIQRRSGGNMQEGVPIRFTLDGGKVFPELAYSNSSGIVGCKVEGVSKNSNSFELSARLDVLALFKDEKPDAVMLKIINKFSPPSVKSKVVVVMPRVFIKGTEKNLGKQNNNMILVNSLRQAATSNGFTVSPIENQAELVIVIDADTRQGSVTYDLYSAMLNATIDVIERSSGNILYSKKVLNQNGVQLSYEKAGESAYENAAESLKKDFFKEFINNWVK